MRKRLVLPSVIAISVNFILFFIKFYIGLRTNCLCIYTDSINNFADTLTGLLALFGFYLISRPATKKYPYGFGRAEYAASFLIAIFMTGAGCAFAYNCVERFFAPTPIWYFARYAVIIGITCVIKLVLGFIFSRFYKKDKSPVTKALMLDSFTDSGITLAALVSFTLSNYAEVIIDAYLGLLISIVITVLGIRLTVSSFGNLMGKACEDITEKAENIIKNIDGNIKIVRISVHNYGIGKNIASIALLGDREKQNNIKKELLDSLNLESTIEWEDIYEQKGKV